MKLEAAGGCAVVTGRADSELICTVGRNATVAAAPIPSHAVQLSRREATADDAPDGVTIADANHADDEVEAAACVEAEAQSRGPLAVEVHGVRAGPGFAQLEAGAGRRGCRRARQANHRQRRQSDGPPEQASSQLQASQRCRSLATLGIGLPPSYHPGAVQISKWR